MKQFYGTKKMLKKYLINSLILLITFIIGFFFLEMFFRVTDGYKIFNFNLEKKNLIEVNLADTSLKKTQALNKNFAKLYPDTPFLNFLEIPLEPIPQKEKNLEYEEMIKQINNDYYKNEFNKYFNSNLIEKINTNSCGEDSNCQNAIYYYCDFKKAGAGYLIAFQSPDEGVIPIYRIRPNYYGQGGQIVYSNYGFLGKDIKLLKPKNTIRLAFLGASTTENSYPAYLTHFLNLWAKKKNLNIDFEMINAGRGGTSSDTMEKVLEYEVKFFEPDLVFYYEGANNFWAIHNLLVKKNNTENYTKPKQFMKESYLPLESISALIKRVYQLIFKSNPAYGYEPEKPDYDKSKWNWSVGSNQLNDETLPLNLKKQINNVKGIKKITDEIDSELFVTSFLLMVKDKMKLDRVRHKYIFENLNFDFWPFTYKDMDYLSNLQNQFFKKAAQSYGAQYIPLAEKFIYDPDFFSDPVHMLDEGTKLQAWIMFQEILPWLEKKIQTGQLPKKSKMNLTSHPYLDQPIRKIKLTRECFSSKIGN